MTNEGNDLNQKVIERMAYVIGRTGMSYADLEEVTGIAKSSIQRYATGQTKKIPINNLQKIATACGVSTNYLLYGTIHEPMDFDAPAEETPAETETIVMDKTVRVQLRIKAEIVSVEVI